MQVAGIDPKTINDRLIDEQRKRDAERPLPHGTVTLAAALKMQETHLCAECVKHGKGGRLVIEPEGVDGGELRCLSHATAVAQVRFP